MMKVRGLGSGEEEKIGRREGERKGKKAKNKGEVIRRELLRNKSGDSFGMHTIYLTRDK
jgi:hypothetical protein